MTGDEYATARAAIAAGTAVATEDATPPAWPFNPDVDWSVVLAAVREHCTDDPIADFQWAVEWGRPFECRHCHLEGRSLGGGFRRIHFCSTACLQAHRRQRPRPSRAKPNTTTSCMHCRQVFTRKRRDACFCSVRCRVAAHRHGPPEWAGGQTPRPATPGQ